MNQTQQIMTAILIMWFITPLVMIVATSFLSARRKLTLLWRAAINGLSFFFMAFLIVLTGVSDRLKPDNPQSWLVLPVFGILFFLITFPSMQFFLFVKGYRSFDEYVQAEKARAKARMEAREPTAWRQRLTEWARHVWEGNCPFNK